MAKKSKGHQDITNMAKSSISNMYANGQFWEDIPDYLVGQASNKISYVLRLIDIDYVMNTLSYKKLTIVDIGCGAGKVSTGFAQALRMRYPGFFITVYGYDLSPQAIDVARKLNNEGEFVCGDFRDYGRKWDLALLLDIIEHIEDPDEFLRSVAEHSQFFVVGFAMDDNLANRLGKRRREKTAVEGGHISLFNEKKAQKLVERFGKVMASGYIDNPIGRNFHIKSVRGLLTLPIRLTLQLVSRRLKGKLFGGESKYFFVESNCFTGGKSSR